MKLWIERLIFNWHSTGLFVDARQGLALSSSRAEENEVPREDKGRYTDKQKRQAEHIAQGYQERGDSKKTAKREAWATVNKETGGGKKSGARRGKQMDTSPSQTGGDHSGKAAARKKSVLKTATRQDGRNK